MPSETRQFSQRAQLSEWMDEPCSYAEFRGCLRDLTKVNRAVLAYRPTMNWLKNVAVSTNVPLHIVDVGCGGGDMLRRIESWARREQVAVKLTGIDLNPFAARAAREFNSANSAIEWITCEAFAYRPPSEIDIVISSLLTHHLSDSEIIRFLRWMEQVAVRGWFVNDLRRGRVPYYTFKLLAHGMRWHPFVRHDGPVSIRRSFTHQDWRLYVREAGLHAQSVNVFSAWPGRLCVARVK